MPELKELTYTVRLKPLSLCTLQERRADLIKVYKMLNSLSDVLFESIRYDTIVGI